jgi:diphthamide biosynthesis protein 2
MSAFGAEAASSFNLEKVSALLAQHGFKRIVLQFPDEHAADCVGVYDWLITDLESRVGRGRADEMEIYVAADSTYGSSVDDISAEHVDGDVLVYFGSDLSSSGAMPVMVVPRAILVDTTACVAAISSQLADYRGEVNAGNGEGSGGPLRAVVTFEPGCSAGVPGVLDALEREHGEWVDFTLARLPQCADLDQWAPSPGGSGGDASADVAVTHLGGLEVPVGSLPSSDSGDGNGDGGDGDGAIIYIGDKTEQLSSVALQAGRVALLHYSNASKACRSMRGENSRAFRERFGGVAKVEKARVVGIIVGSMGLTGESTRSIVARLQALCEAGGRKTYVFIMGRLNEAKLCNFPEIEVFCLVSNEDTSVIAPKTFPVPVITPWELELGLGAREWQSSYHSRPTSIFDEGEGEGEVESEQRGLERALERVREARKNSAYLSDQESEGEGEEGSSGVGRVLGDEEHYREEEGENGEISSRRNSTDAQRGREDPRAEPTGQQSASQLVRVERQEGRVVEFKSAAADFFAGRKWQGLAAEVTGEEGASLAIQEGLSGIASGYNDRKPSEEAEEC